MQAPVDLQKAFRAGTFFTLQSADRAVERLLAAHFPKEHIKVLCTDGAKERHFLELGYKPPDNADGPDGVGAGAFLGASAGGLAAIAVGAATGIVPLIIAGAAGVAGGSAIGGFLGALHSGDGDNEVVTFYDQELRNGRILVVVEDHGPDANSMLEQAATILADCGPPSAAEPSPVSG
jgi:hypothetical protein